MVGSSRESVFQVGNTKHQDTEAHPKRVVRETSLQRAGLAEEKTEDSPRAIGEALGALKVTARAGGVLFPFYDFPVLG